jgi:hypothetical protein
MTFSGKSTSSFKMPRRLGSQTAGSNALETAYFTLAASGWVCRLMAVIGNRDDEAALLEFLSYIFKIEF